MGKIKGIILALLAFIGLLLVFGAFGNGDVYGRLTGSDYAHIALGMVMLGAAMFGGEVSAE